MTDWLGSFSVTAGRTHVRFSFTTHDATGANVAPNSAFESADLRIYKNGSATQRSSSNGITMTSPFDSLTGTHNVDIDLTDNTDAGFYTADSDFEVMLCPDETIDSVTITARVLVRFDTYATAKAIKDAIDTVDDFLDTEVAAIKAKTDNLPTDPADASDIAALIGGLDTKLDTIDDLLDTEVQAIKTKTDNLPSDPADASVVAGLIAALEAKVDTIDDFLDTEIAAIKAKTDGLPADPADASDVAASFSSVAATLATIASYLDTEVAAIKAKTDNLPSSPAAVGSAMTLAADSVSASTLAADAVSEITTAIKAMIIETEGSYSLGQVMSILLAACAGVTDDSGATLKTPNGAATRISGTVASGERTAITLTPSS